MSVTLLCPVYGPYLMGSDGSWHKSLFTVGFEVHFPLKTNKEIEVFESSSSVNNSTQTFLTVSWVTTNMVSTKKGSNPSKMKSLVAGPTAESPMIAGDHWEELQDTHLSCSGLYR